MRVIKVTVESLLEYKERLAVLLGHNFIQELANFKTTGLPWSDCIRVNQAVHPLSQWWSSFCKEVHDCLESGSIRLSEGSFRLLDILNDLEMTLDVPNIGLVVERLKQRHDYFGARFELKTASMYRVQGAHIEMIPVSEDQGVKTNDILIKHGNRDIYVECKSLENTKVKESPLWSEIQHRVENVLRKYRRSWKITIFAGKQIDGKLKDNIIKDIEYNAKSNNLNVSIVESDKIFIEYQMIGEWDKIFFDNFNCIGMSDLVYFGFEQATANGIMKNLTVIEIHPDPRLNLSSRIMKELKKAARQIPANGMGIIHIEIPHKMGDSFLHVVDKNFEDVYNKINFDYSRINSVVLSAVTYEPNLHISPLIDNHYIIPKHNTKNSLPKGFRIIGTNPTVTSIPSCEGTVEFKFGMFEDWNQSVPSFIYNNSSGDGAYQLRVWRTWSNRFRMDVVTPGINGRRIAECSEIDIEKGNEYHFAGTWSKSGANLYLNGIPIKE